jgi:Sec-independent protein translocase protein TatA
MILLSPPKLLMILAVALIVLGPDKLPSAARRVGAMWHEFMRWRAHLEREVRATFPDLPSTTEIAQAVRSPLSVLDRLADEHDAANGGRAPSTANTAMASVPGTDAGAPHASTPPSGPPRALPLPGVDLAVEPDVSSMN